MLTVPAGKIRGTLKFSLMNTDFDNSSIKTYQELPRFLKLWKSEMKAVHSFSRAKNFLATVWKGWFRLRDILNFGNSYHFQPAKKFRRSRRIAESLPNLRGSPKTLLRLKNGFRPKNPSESVLIKVLYLLSISVNLRNSPWNLNVNG